VTPRQNPLNAAGEPRAFFGRRSGKRLHRGHDVLFRELLPELAISLPEGVLDPRALFENPKKLTLEIGYGGGEHLARQARTHPEDAYIGCEVFTGGIAKLLQKLPDASLDEVYLLYPDPWPKTRHHKRRFVSPLTLAELARTIRPGGKFNFATDIEDYADWTLAHILRAPGFVFEPGAPGSWHEPYPGWEPTRYEQKARREGRLKSFYLTFERRD